VLDLPTPRNSSPYNETTQKLPTTAVDQSVKAMKDAASRLYTFTETNHHERI